MSGAPFRGRAYDVLRFDRPIEAEAHPVVAAIESGTVWVNTWLLRDLRVPFGGMNESGLGREDEFDSLDFFTRSEERLRQVVRIEHSENCSGARS